MSCTCSLQRILKLCQAIVGISVIVLGVWNFFNEALYFQPIVLNIYFCFFGLLLALTALNAQSYILAWFPFLNNWFGIGAYMVWLGFLCINTFRIDSFQTWVGLIAVGAGVISIIVHFSSSSTTAASQPLL
jgi:hypothetical protein